MDLRLMNRLAARFGIDFPLFQAGMGGIARPELAAAVSNAGAGGVLALYRMDPGVVRSSVRHTRSLTARPFGVNLIPELMSSDAIAAQLEAVLSESDASTFFSFYGLPDDAACKRMLEVGRPFLVMVGNVADVTSAEALGATGIVVQGTEAGGHLLGTSSVFDLLVEARDSGCRVPLLAAGGIAHGRHFSKALDHGAAGCLCGTLFVATLESAAHPQYKARLVAAAASDTIVTNIFDAGWLDRRHRVLRNALTELCGGRRPRAFIATAQYAGRQYPLPRYSAMVPTVDVRGQITEMAMYGGTSVAGVYGIPTAGVRVRRLMAECRAMGRSLNDGS